MRIGIREQLAFLVLFTTLLALAVVAIATWVNNYNFVLNIRSSALSLTAALYAEQLNSNLFLLLSSVEAISSRVLVQQALQRYNQGNATDANWVRARSDLLSALGGGGASDMLLQAEIFSKNGSGINGSYSLVNVSSTDLPSAIPLPGTNLTGGQIYLGDNTTGYPSQLYPNLTYSSVVVNDTFNHSTASFAGRQLSLNSSILLGPWLINETFGLLSITVPLNNLTSTEDTLGWLTVVMNAQAIIQIDQAVQGLGNSGQLLLVAPSTTDQRLPPGSKPPANRTRSTKVDSSQLARFVVPPIQNSSRSIRHPDRAYGTSSPPFAIGSYPAVMDAFSSPTSAISSSGSLISTKNEQGLGVSVGYALVGSSLVDWVLLVEEAHSEVVAPILHLRNVLLACVFGTVGGVLLFLIPIAHFFVKPIRQLQAATKRTVSPEQFGSDNGSFQSFSRSLSDHENFGGDPDMNEAARKEGFVGRLVRWTGRKDRHAENEVAQKRRSTFRIPGKVPERRHIIFHDELTDLTRTFNEMSEELTMQYHRLEERVKVRTQELEISKKAAEVANETKTLFIANISHELKTPLNGILGMCSVSMQEEDPIKIKRSLRIIHNSGDLLYHLLTDLLTFTKNQMGQQLTLDEREFKLSDVCAQVLAIFEQQARESHINLRIRYQGPQDQMEPGEVSAQASGFGPQGTGRIKDMLVWGDQHRILQVIINLVSNSLKFTPPRGSIDICIRCVGDAPEKAESRKESLQSKASKVNSKRGVISRVFSAVPSTHSPRSRSREDSKYSDTALHINVREPKSGSMSGHERSPSPSSIKPFNMRSLVFEFEVEDTGPGIPQSQQQKVFEPFMQGDLGLSKKYGGTGLGLSICSQLATLMRGHIQLASEEGRGSRFTMRIPLGYIHERAESASSSRPDSRRNSSNMDGNSELANVVRRRSSSDLSEKSNKSIPPTINGFESSKKPRLVGLSQPFFATGPPPIEADKQLAAMEQAKAAAAETGVKVRVLVAEDNPVNQEVVLRMLKLEDIYDVTVAKDGQEAFELVKQSMEQSQRFDVVFMDVQMPNLDGIQSTRLIREMGYSAPIVALTAFAEESNVKECMDSGMDFFLPKPIRRPALKQVLKRYCATIPEAPEEDQMAEKSRSPFGVTSNDNEPPVARGKK